MQIDTHLLTLCADTKVICNNKNDKIYQSNWHEMTFSISLLPIKTFLPLCSFGESIFSFIIVLLVLVLIFHMNICSPRYTPTTGEAQQHTHAHIYIFLIQFAMQFMFPNAGRLPLHTHTDTHSIMMTPIIVIINRRVCTRIAVAFCLERKPRQGVTANLSCGLFFRRCSCCCCCCWWERNERIRETTVCYGVGECVQNCLAEC